MDDQSFRLFRLGDHGRYPTQVKPTADHTFPDGDVLEWSLTDSGLVVRMSDVHYEERLRGPTRLRFPLLRLCATIVNPTSGPNALALNRAWFANWRARGISMRCHEAEKLG